MHQFRHAVRIPQWVEDDLTSQPHLTTQFSYVNPAHKWNDWILDISKELRLTEWRATCRIVQPQEVIAPHITSQIEWPNLNINDRELKYYVLFTQAPIVVSYNPKKLLLLIYQHKMTGLILNEWIVN